MHLQGGMAELDADAWTDRVACEKQGLFLQLRKRRQPSVNPVDPEKHEEGCAPNRANGLLTALKTVLWTVLDAVQFAYCCAMQRLGLGSTFHSCFTADERRFLAINARKIEQILLQPSVFRAAAEAASESYSPTAASSTSCGDATPATRSSHSATSDSHRSYQLCPVLRELGDQPIPWDALQQLVFVASDGRLFAERFGTVTEDGVVLVLHRLVRLSDKAHAQLTARGACSVRMYLHSVINAMQAGRWGKTLRDLIRFAFTPMCAFDPHFQEVCARQSTPSSELEGPIELKGSEKCVLFGHGLVESSLNWLWQGMGNNREPLAMRMDRSAALALAFDGDAEVWLCNNRGNNFTRSVSEIRRTREFPTGWQSYNLEGIRRLRKLYRSSWSYEEMCTQDMDAIYSCVASHTISKNVSSSFEAGFFRPYIVAFSQSCKILFDAYSRAEVSSWVRPRGVIMVSPPFVIEHHALSLRSFLRCPWGLQTRLGLFFWFAYEHMSVLALGIVEPMRHSLHLGIVAFAGTAVVYALNFAQCTIGGGRIWMRTTPSSLVSKAHLQNWGKHELGSPAAENVVSLNRLRVHAPVRVYVPLRDTIVNGPAVCELLKAVGGANTHVCMWSLASDPAARRVEETGGDREDEANEHMKRFDIVKMPGMSHLDPTWSTEGRRVHADIAAFIKASEHVARRPYECT